MNEEKKFLILDIDGVLLEPHGYRAGCIDTVNDFLSKLGQPFLSIDKTIPEALEAAGITAEWDMIPLILAAFVNWYYQLFPQPSSCSDFPVPLGNEIIKDNQVFYQMLLEKILDYQHMLDPNQTPIISIYHFLSCNEGKGLERLWKLPIRDRFFVDTLNPWKCQFFAQLMNRLLGADKFETFYGLKPLVNCDSYLETMDRLLISEHYRSLLPKITEKSFFPAVMTYRPTRLPSANGNKDSKYFVNTPEGECAMNLLSWSDGDVPMIGAGSLCFIEEKYNLRREYYVKPHPFHALASIMISLCKDEIQALETARSLCELDPEKDDIPTGLWIKPGESIKIMVFEDSVSGINSVKNAAAILNKWGIHTQPILCGIRSTKAKDALLKETGADLYANINEALDSVFKQYTLKE